MLKWLSREEYKTLKEQAKKKHNKQILEASISTNNRILDHQLEVFRHFTTGNIWVHQRDLKVLKEAKRIINNKRQEITRNGRPWGM